MDFAGDSTPDHQLQLDQHEKSILNRTAEAASHMVASDVQRFSSPAL